MADDELPSLLMDDAWDLLPEDLRHEFLSRRMTSAGWGPYRRQEPDSTRWEPLRPIVIGEVAYRHLGALAARLLHLAVDACRRRASTLNDLHQVLRFPHDLPLMDPDRPLVATELTRYARPDILIEKGRPRFVEFNNSTRLGGDTVAHRLAEACAGLCPQSGLHPPPSTVAARSAALTRTLRARTRNGSPGRLLVPTHWAIDSTGALRRRESVKAPILADARRIGLEVVQADLADLRLDAAGRLLAAGVPIDVVLLQWGSSDRIVDDGGGLAALRTADRAGTVALFPRTESVLVSSKAVLAWLHDDCEAGLLTSADRALVRAHIPWTACLGLGRDPAANGELLRTIAGERDRLVAKPAVGKSGTDVFFGSRTAPQDWLPAVVRAAREAPLVLQRRVAADGTTMPFRDRDSGHQVTAPVPFVLSPFIVDGAAASGAVRHMIPGGPAADVVISAQRGARPNTVLLAPEHALGRTEVK
jgi:hypothetical protein